MQSFAMVQWGRKFASNLENNCTKYKVVETVSIQNGCLSLAFWAM